VAAFSWMALQLRAQIPDFQGTNQHKKSNLPVVY